MRQKFEGHSHVQKRVELEIVNGGIENDAARLSIAPSVGQQSVEHSPVLRVVEARVPSASVFVPAHQ